MEIKEPAAIFSEAGLKMFIEAIQEAERTKFQSPNQDTEVDRLVKEYKEFKGNESESNRLDTIAEYLTEFMIDGERKTTEAILNYLNDVCGYDFTLRSMTSTMRGVMNRNPRIEKINAKQYKLKLEEAVEDVEE